MIPKYIKLETLRQQQEKEIGGDISLFDLAANLRTMEEPLFIHKSYLSENNIVARMPGAYPFCYEHDLIPFQKPLSEFIYDFSKRGGQEDFYEISLGNPTTQGLHEVYLIMPLETHEALSKIHRELPPESKNNYDRDNYFELRMLLWDKKEWKKRSSDFITGYKYNNPLWWLLEPHKTTDIVTSIDALKSGKLITIPYSALYVMNKDVNRKNKQTATLSSLETISNKKQPAETYLEKRIAEKLPELEHDKANYKRLVEVLKRYEVGDLSLTIENAEIQETRKEVYAVFNRFGLSTDQKRTLDNFCKVEMLHFRKGRRPKQH